MEKNDISNNFSLKNFKKILSNIDLFGQKIELNYNKETVYKTYYGAIYTIIVVLFLIFQAIAGYLDLTTRLNPIINMMEAEGDTVPKVKLRGKIFHEDDEILNSGITLAFGLVSNNRSEYMYDPRYFSFEIKFLSKSKSEAVTKIDTKIINSRNCNLNDFREFPSIYESYNLKSAICIDSSDPIEIFSNYNEFRENYIKFTLTYCRNTSEIVCKNKDEIEKRLDNLNFYMYFYHDFFDGSDLKRPIKKRLSMEKWTFDDNLIRRKDSILLTAASIQDYNNLLIDISDPPIKKFYTYSERDIIRIYKIADDEESREKILDLNIKSRIIPLKIVRKYNTFLDLLAVLGGLFNFFFLLGTVIFAYVGKTMLYFDIINERFNIIKSQDCNIPLEKSPFKNFKCDRISFTLEDTNQFSLGRDSKLFDSKKEKLITRYSSSSNNSGKFSSDGQKKIILKYRFKDFISTIICSKKNSLKRKDEIYTYCSKIIDDYLDFRILMTTLQEYKISKSLLFDSLQLSLIKEYSKPIIKIQTDEKKEIIYIYRKSVEQDLPVFDNTNPLNPNFKKY
jgi:hypothetical protein